MVSSVADGSSVTPPSSSVHDSPDKPLPPTSHDCSATPPQSIHDSLTNETISPTINDICLSPVIATADHPSPTLPSILQESPAVEFLPSTSCDPPDMPSHDIPATPPHSVKDPSQDNMQTSPATPSQSEHTPPLLTNSSHDQLQFNDPDIINTQLNYQISEVKNFLKTDNLKLTKPKPMATHNMNI